MGETQTPKIHEGLTAPHKKMEIFQLCWENADKTVLPMEDIRNRPYQSRITSDQLAYFASLSEANTVNKTRKGTLCGQGSAKRGKRGGEGGDHKKSKKLMERDGAALKYDDDCGAHTPGFLDDLNVPREGTWWALDDGSCWDGIGEDPSQTDSYDLLDECKSGE
jgi:hypothetical protein